MSPVPSQPGTTAAIAPAHEDEWQQYRALRIEMLTDSPLAFSDRAPEVESWGDSRWQTRLASMLLPDSTLLVARDSQGAWIGQMAAREYLHTTPAAVWLLEVYLSPMARGTGLGNLLLEGVIGWAEERGHRRIFLDVHEHAAAARRFYSRHGFSETGNQQPYPLDPSQREIEMVRALNP